MNIYSVQLPSHYFNKEKCQCHIGARGKVGRPPKQCGLIPACLYEMSWQCHGYFSLEQTEGTTTWLIISNLRGAASVANTIIGLYIIQNRVNKHDIWWICLLVAHELDFGLEFEQTKLHSSLDKRLTVTAVRLFEWDISSINTVSTCCSLSCWTCCSFPIALRGGLCIFLCAFCVSCYVTPSLFHFPFPIKFAWLYRIYRIRPQGCNVIIPSVKVCIKWSWSVAEVNVLESRSLCYLFSELGDVRQIPLLTLKCQQPGSPNIHFGTDWNISTNTGQITIQVITVIHGPQMIIDIGVWSNTG